MTFYTEKFNGVDEDADKPSQPSQWDSLKNVPFRDHENFADDGIPWKADSTTQYTPDLRDPSEQADAGIPWNSPDSRPPARAGSLEESIAEDKEELEEMQKTADTEQRTIDNWQKGLNKELADRLGAVETNYVKDRTDLPGRKKIELGEPIDEEFALRRILYAQDAKELESYIDTIQNDEDAIKKVLNRGFGIASEERGAVYNELHPKNINNVTRRELMNFISVFASLVERGINIPKDFDNVALYDKGSSFSRSELPLGVAMVDIAQMVDEKGFGEANVDNPINELSGANGEEKINVRRLTDLALKARMTDNKLSADTINFPA